MHLFAFWLIVLITAFFQVVHTTTNHQLFNFPDLYEASILQLQEGLEAGHFSSLDLIRAYLARIHEVNLEGPSLRAILEINPLALTQAAALDSERGVSGKRSILHGIPILLKDNIATMAAEGMNTTSGSFALLGSVVPDDAEVVKRLRRAGAIILGKANLSEFAHFRGNLASGWSGRGGQCTNAYYANGDPCGSSSGSAVAASIGLVAVTLGTETDGSITCPSANNNVVGIKPTVGLTSRAGVIPVSENQDTVGPLARSMTDAAIVLSVIAGPDAKDSITFTQPYPIPDYTKALNKNALNGKRIGVPRRVFLNDTLSGNDPFVNVIFEEALKIMRELGAIIIDPADLPSAEEIIVSNNETFVTNVNFKVQINQYFTNLVENPSGVRNLSQLIEFNNAHPNLEEPTGYTSQTDLVAAEATTGRNESFLRSLAFNFDLGATRGIDAALNAYNLHALVLPMPASKLATVPSAIAGYPIVTVPLGFYPDNVTIGSAEPPTFYPAPGMPIGLSFLGTAFSEFDLISFGYAYEQKTQTRLVRKAYPAAIPKTQLKDVIGGHVNGF